LRVLRIRHQSIQILIQKKLLRDCQIPQVTARICQSGPSKVIDSGICTSDPIFFNLKQIAVVIPDKCEKTSVSFGNIYDFQSVIAAFFEKRFQVINFKKAGMFNFIILKAFPAVRGSVSLPQVKGTRFPV